MEFVSTSPVFLSHRDSVKTKFARHPYQCRPRTLVGHDVWIGEGALIKAGVCVGHGSVIGMGSIVTKDVQPYSIVAGNPAELIRMRFDPDVVGALLRLEWWNWSDEQLVEYGAYFNDPRMLLAKIRAP